MSTDLDHPDDRRYLAWLLVILGVLYGLLLGPQWSAGPDTAYYMSIARSIAIGRGVEFNGGTVGRAPPGWSFVLAGLLRISSSFIFLGACNLLMMLGSAAAWYRVLRRIVPPARACAVVLLSGILYWWYCSTVQLRTEALFCVIFAPVVLLALQVAEGRTAWWRIGLLLLGCTAMILVRFAGLTAVAVVVAALLTRLTQTRRTSLIVAVAVVVVTGASFLGARKLITDILPRYIVPRAHMGAAIPGVQALDAFDHDDSAPPVMTSVLGGGKIMGYVARAASGGQWLAGYLWMPLHAADSNARAAMVVNLFGWALIGVVMAGTWQCGKQGFLLPLGAVIYCASIIGRWASVNPRYLMPVTPLLLLAFWLAMDHARTKLKSPAMRKLNLAAVRIWIASLILTNGALYAVDVFIARSTRFYYYYNGGELQQLASVSKYLLDHKIADGDVATNYFVVSTINKVRPNGYAHRGLVLLTDRGINVVPNNLDAGEDSGSKKRSKAPKRVARPATVPGSAELTKAIAGIHDGHPDNPAVARFCQLCGIRYYVYRPPGAHAWHFRKSQLPSFLIGKNKAPKVTPDWELFELIDGKLQRVTFPLLDSWPRGVPGV